MTPLKKTRSTHQIINLILASFIAAILLYSALFSARGYSHPIPSLFTEITGLPTASTGLSRSLSALLRGEFTLAQQFNDNGLIIMFFLFSQLFFRTALFLLINKRFSSTNSLIMIDITLSLLTFLLAFQELIRFTISLFGFFIVN